MRARRIVVVGSLNADFVITMQRFPDAGETVVGDSFAVIPGGKGANQAYAAARLGGNVAMVGQVGNDSHGAWLKQHLASAGVDVNHVQSDEAVATGVAVIGVDAAGQNRIVLAPGANGAFGVERLKISEGFFSAGDIVLLQLEIPLATVTHAARLAKQADAMVILDPAPARDIGRNLLQWVDYVTPNETELATLTRPSDKAPDVAARAAMLRDLGAKRVIVKMGASGALLVHERGEQCWPALPVQAIDTTAAGDAFNGAFAVGLAEGQAEIDAGCFATAAAACSVTRPGAQPSMPTRAEVEDLLHRHKS